MPLRACLLAVPLVLTLAGCTQNVCDRIAKSHAALAQKAQPCGVDEGVFDTAGCKAKLSSCSNPELDSVTAVWNCQDKLPACSPSSRVSWEYSQGACGTNEAVTFACNQAVQVTAH